MLIFNTIILSTDPVAKNKNATIALSEFGIMLISDSYKGVVASMLEQIRSDQELVSLVKLTEKEYAATKVTPEQVAYYQLEYPEATYQQAADELAKQQLAILKVAATTAMPKLKIDKGNISSKLFFNFSQTQNVYVGNAVLPKLDVRPPSSKASNTNSSTLIGEVVFNFKMTE